MSMISDPSPSLESYPAMLQTCSYENTPLFSPWKDRTLPCKVVHVYDGDTCYVAVPSPFDHHHSDQLVKIKIRLSGIDAFELNGDSKVLGFTGRDRLIAWIVEPSGTTLPTSFPSRKSIAQFLEVHSPILYAEVHGYDKYGRILCVLKRNAEDSFDASANAMLVREGHARPYLGYAQLTAEEDA